MNVPKLELIINVLNSINPVLILRERRRIEENRREISHIEIYDVVSKELPIFVKEMPNLLEYEICGFQDATRRGEFTFPKHQTTEECVAIYFKYEAKRLGLNIKEKL